MILDHPETTDIMDSFRRQSNFNGTNQFISLSRAMVMLPKCYDTHGEGLQGAT